MASKKGHIPLGILRERHEKLGRIINRRIKDGEGWGASGPKGGMPSRRRQKNTRKK